MEGFTIRISGAPPAPAAAPGARKGGGMGGGKKKKPGAAPPAQQQQQRHTLRGLLPTTSASDLTRRVFDAYGVPVASRDGLAVRFLGGFPPRELSAEDEGRDDLDGLGVGPNESLIVRFVPLDGNPGVAASSSASKKKAAGDEKKGPAPNGSDEGEAKPAAAARPKRAAAAEASRNFASVIAAQDAMMAGSASPKSKKRGGAAAGGGKKSANNKSGKRAKITGTGYRLRDGAASASPAKPRAAARKRPAAGKQEAAFSSKDDVASGLLSSLNGGGGNVGRFLRAAMGGAVERTYEAARARARVAAVASGGYSFEAVGSGGRVGGGHVLEGADGGEGGHQTVSYSRGIDGRGTNEDDVEIIPADAAKAALEMVYRTPPDGSEEEDGREMLRPASVAQMSPRLFWSVVYHSNRGADSAGGGAPPSFEEMLVALLPELDWTFLGRGGRRRALSEKARENRAQERAAENGGDGGDGEGADEESARRAIERLEDDIVRSAVSADDGGGEPAEDERERRAQAALARLGGASSAGVATEENGGFDAEWHVVTPNDDDIDELLECIRAVDAPYVQNNASAWADALLPSVPNWRRLADLSPAEVLSILTGAGAADPPDEGTAARWIDEAQARTLEEVMSEILDGDGPALDRLCGEDVRSGNPRDLARWGTCPSLLAGAVNAPVPGGGSGDGDGEEDAPRWTEEDAGRWTSRARTALADLPWLAEFGHG